MDDDALLDVARKLIILESDAIKTLSNRLDESFLVALKMIDECENKVIVSGLGKSGIAGRKIAATLASIGEPALFMHSAEAVHGDMGVISKGDVAICISYSGETRELMELIPRFRLQGVPVIAMTGNTDSALANLADCVLDVSVPSLPWPYGILPTSSNAVTVAVGDALAVALMVKRGVKEEDFALLHPGGLLGTKMLVRVSDIMHTGKALPVVTLDTRMKEALVEMTVKRLGVTCVVDEDGKLKGIITDGDLRRLLKESSNPLELTAAKAMTSSPKTISPKNLSARALHIMENHNITSLPVADDNGRLMGLIHLHDILKLETDK
ncbi:KpsF/GutQ family sugar-phosphate isomerase [bacterium]|nr:KpsF/GutQ family sugar-phosphate isomerase [bacterium]